LFAGRDGLSRKEKIIDIRVPVKVQGFGVRDVTRESRSAEHVVVAAEAEPQPFLLGSPNPDSAQCHKCSENAKPKLHSFVILSFGREKKKRKMTVLEINSASGATFDVHVVRNKSNGLITAQYVKFADLISSLGGRDCLKTAQMFDGARLHRRTPNGFFTCDAAGEYIDQHNAAAFMTQAFKFLCGALDKPEAFKSPLEVIQSPFGMNLLLVETQLADMASVIDNEPGAILEPSRGYCQRVHELGKLSVEGVRAAEIAKEIPLAVWLTEGILHFGGVEHMAGRKKALEGALKMVI
jgi:hypothetical protein